MSLKKILASVAVIAVAAFALAYPAIAQDRARIGPHSTLRSQVFVTAAQPILSTSAFRAATALSTLTVGTPLAMTTTLCPGIGGRNIEFTFVDADTDSTIQLRVDGYDQWNRPISETLPATGSYATSTSLTEVGTKIFTTVTQIVPLAISVGDATIDTVAVGTADKVGLPFQFSADLHEIKQASLLVAGDATITVKTVNTTNFDTTNFAVKAALFASSHVATGDVVQILYFSDGATPDNIDYPQR